MLPMRLAPPLVALGPVDAPALGPGVPDSLNVSVPIDGVGRVAVPLLAD